MEKYNCEVCGKAFIGSSAKKNKYCSIECYRSFQRSGKYKRPGAKKWYNNCYVCSKEVNKRPSINTDGSLCDKVFCSRECYNKYHDKENWAKKVTCVGCGKEIKIYKSRKKYNNYFCSVACRRALSHESECVQCGVKFSGIQIRKTISGVNVIRVQRKTCSNKCLSEFYKSDVKRKEKISQAFIGEKHPLWAGGISRVRGFRGPFWQQTRKKAIKNCSDRCVVCGMKRVKHFKIYKRDFDVDHIKPFHEFESYREANKLNNLRSLCVYCHAIHGKKADKNNANVIRKVKKYGIMGNRYSRNQRGV